MLQPRLHRQGGSARESRAGEAGGGNRAQRKHAAGALAAHEACGKLPRALASCERGAGIRDGDRPRLRPAMRAHGSPAWWSDRNRRQRAQFLGGDATGGVDAHDEHESLTAPDFCGTPVTAAPYRQVVIIPKSTEVLYFRISPAARSGIADSLARLRRMPLRCS
jgi:hypothetical protein